MTAWRQAIELSIGDEEVARLVTITRSRTEPANRVERARMLLAYRENPSFFAIAHAVPRPLAKPAADAALLLLGSFGGVSLVGRAIWAPTDGLDWAWGKPSSPVASA